MTRAVTFNLQGNAKSYNNAVRSAAGSTSTFIGSLKSMQSSMLSMVGRIATLQTNMLGLQSVFQAFRGAKDTLQTFRSFEEGMLRVEAVTSGTQEEMARLRDMVEDLTVKTKYTAPQILEAAFALASMGVKGKDLEDMLPTISQTAIALGADVGQTAETTLATMKVFGVGVDKAADVIVNAYTKSALNLERYTVAMQYAGPAALAYNQKLEDIVAILALLKDRGIDASMAGTQLRMAMAISANEMQRAQDVLDKYNLSARDFDLETRSFIDVLDTMSKAQMRSSDVMDVFGKRAGPLVKVLLSMGSETESLADKLHAMSKSFGEAGTSAKVSAKMQTGFSFAVDQVSAAFDLLKTNVGEALVGWFDLDNVAVKLSDSLVNLIEVVKALDFSVLKDAGVKIFDPSEIGQNLRNAFDYVLPAAIDLLGTAAGYGAIMLVKIVGDHLPDIAKLAGIALGKVVIEAFKGINELLYTGLQRFVAWTAGLWEAMGADTKKVIANMESAKRTTAAFYDELENAIFGKTGMAGDKLEDMKKKVETLKESLTKVATEQQKETFATTVASVKENIAKDRERKADVEAQREREKQQSVVSAVSREGSRESQKALAELLMPGGEPLEEEVEPAGNAMIRKSGVSKVNIDNRNQIIHNYGAKNRNEQISTDLNSRNPKGEKL